MDKIDITFGYSTSKSYKRAIELAKKCSSYSEKDGEHHITWRTEDADAIIPLYRLIEDWKCTRVMINDKQVRHPRILVAWTYCYDQIIQDPRKGNCFRLGYANIAPIHPFGCKSGRDIGFWTYSPWLRLGTLQGREWTFDKPSIKKFVEYKTLDYRLCPNQRPAWIEAFLDVFPVSIDPTRDRLWTYQTKEGLERIFSMTIQFGGITNSDDEPESKPEIVGVGPKNEIAAEEIIEQLFTMVHLKYNLTGG